MVLVTGVCLAWAASPNVPVKVEGAALFLTPGSRIGLYARSPGQIQRLPLRIGQTAAQGDLIASIDRIDQAFGSAPKTCTCVTPARSRP